MEEAKVLLDNCLTAMSEKLMFDHGFNVIGWEEMFKKSLDAGKRYQNRCMKEEADRIFEVTVNTPISNMTTFCPYCHSEDVREGGWRSTLLASPDMNHHWISCVCNKCNNSFTKEHKNSNVWYVDQNNRVMRGVPSCYEEYILTCKRCGGDLKREIRKEGYFFVCNCGINFEYPPGNWHNYKEED